MNHKPTITIKDNPHNCEISLTAFAGIDLTNEFEYFANGKNASAYRRFSSIKPLKILPCLNLPGMSVQEAKKRANGDAALLSPCMPFTKKPNGNGRLTFRL